MFSYSAAAASLPGQTFVESEHAFVLSALQQIFVESPAQHFFVLSAQAAFFASQHSVASGSVVAAFLLLQATTQRDTQNKTKKIFFIFLFFDGFENFCKII
jgi:hypothetical protein